MIKHPINVCEITYYCFSELLITHVRYLRNCIVVGRRLDKNVLLWRGLHILLLLSRQHRLLLLECLEVKHTYKFFSIRFR
jgi:hypothetical protein